jgi:hypothetical protein
MAHRKPSAPVSSLRPRCLGSAGFPVSKTITVIVAKDQDGQATVLTLQGDGGADAAQVAVPVVVSPEHVYTAVSSAAGRTAKHVRAAVARGIRVGSRSIEDCLSLGPGLILPKALSCRHVQLL